MKIDKELAIEMRKEGKTYQEIGAYFGVSHQAVAKAVNNVSRARKSSPVFEQIPYKGLYEFMQANKKVTIWGLAKIMGMDGSHTSQEKLRRFLLGRDVLLHKHAYDNLIARTGMTYEQLFELREGFEKDVE